MPRTVFRNGSVFDGRRHRPGEALVVEDGRVLAVAPAAALPASGRHVEVVDLAGGLVSPGFVDAHVHAVQGGLERLRCDLSGWSSRSEYLAAVAAYAAARPAEPWIVGGGWALSAFPGGVATAADLDAAVPDRPAYLLNRDHHGAWVNSRAMELAGLDAQTPDPPDGHLDRDRVGRPVGTLHEGAMALVGRLLPATGAEMHYRALLEGQRHLHSVGVTGWQDAILGDYAGIEDPSDSYLQAARSGDLTAWVVGALWWDRDRGLDQIPELVERRAALCRGRLRATSVKVMQDGIVENGTAALSEPYLGAGGRPTGNRGHSFVPGEELVEVVPALAAAGFQVHVHAIGDRAVREALDAFTAARVRDRARPDGAAPLRHHIAHLQVVHPHDVPRFAELGVTATCQALWACLDDQMVELTLPVLGEPRAGWQYPFGALHRAGAALAMGSDWPVSSPDPLQAIHVAVNRKAHGASGRAGHEAFLPGQALDLTTAFSAYTVGSARLNHRDECGLLAPGWVADLVVLDRDPFAGPVDEIGAARVVSTWVDGRPVFSDPDGPTSR